MRGLPYKLSIAAFSKRLRCNVDSAKRWLVTWPAQNIVEVQKSRGGHWAVNLPKGDYSLLKCRIQRAQEKLFQRKQSRTAMPFMVEPLSGEKPHVAGVNAPWMWQDLDGLLKQLLEEMDPDEPSMSVCQPELNEYESKVSYQLMQVDDKTLTTLVASYVLKRAAISLQKTDKKLTVQAMAQTLGMSLASLYRTPFGKSIVQRIIQDTNGGSSDSTIGLGKGEAIQEGLSIERKLEERTYKDRKPTIDRQKLIKSRHFLCWHATDWPLGRQATLVLIPETEVEISVRPSYPKNPLKESLPQYSEAELLRILRWLEQNSVMERKPVGAVSPKEGGSGYHWYYDAGQYRGESPTWEQGAASVLRVFRPERFNRKFAILNPKANGLYQIPVYLSQRF